MQLHAFPTGPSKQYWPEPNEDVESTALTAYNESSGSDPYYIISKITDHSPKSKMSRSNLTLRIMYKGYPENHWYQASSQILKTEAFAVYATGFPELAQFIPM